MPTAKRPPLSCPISRRPSGCWRASVRRRPLGDPDRLPPREQRPPPPPEALGSRQRQPRSSQRETYPPRRASASASLPWLLARPDRNFTRHVPAIARTMSAWRCSAISARDGSRSATANCMRHRPQQSRHPRQPESEIVNRHGIRTPALKPDQVQSSAACPDLVEGCYRLALAHFGQVANGRDELTHRAEL